MRIARTFAVTTLAVAAVLFAGQPAAASSSYEKVCETTGISQARGGTPTYTVYAGNNVNVRSIKGGWAQVNYPTPGYLPAAALCSQQ